MCRFYAAGRTDTGVHAYGQVAHVDIPKPFAPFVLQKALNAQVRPFPVAILHVEEADATFHARLSARMRHYRYRILNRGSPSPLGHQRFWHVGRPLDSARMRSGVGYLIGHHDFTTFRAAACQARSPWRTLTSANVHANGEVIDIGLSAPSFLHHQVRSIVGCLKKVGEGIWEPNHIKTLLHARSRVLCAPLAPPFGLYLERVDYNEQG